MKSFPRPVFIVLFVLLAVNACLASFVFSRSVRSWVASALQKGPIAVPYEPTDLSPSVPVETLHPAQPIDLDRDGKPEEITLATFSPAGYGDPDTARLQIGSATTTIENALAEKAIFETRLGDHGEYSAIALTLSVPNEQVTEFFGYQNGNIVSLGTIPGAFPELTFDERHHIHTMQRGRLLDTWFHEGEYALTSNGAIEEVPHASYERHTEVRLKQPFAFVASPSSTRIAFRLNADDRATITSCDEVAWCSLQTPDGKTGWFELVENYNLILSPDKKKSPRPRMDPFDLFDGLSNAG